MKKLFLIISSLFLLSCTDNNMVIEDGDIVSICIVDSVWSKQPISTLEFEPTYYYKTSCNNTLVTRAYQAYQVGDTIKFVKKKIK